MKICELGHVKVVYTSMFCPCCKLLQEKEDLYVKQEEMMAQIVELKEDMEIIIDGNIAIMDGNIAMKVLIAKFKNYSTL